MESNQRQHQLRSTSTTHFDLYTGELHFKTQREQISIASPQFPTAPLLLESDLSPRDREWNLISGTIPNILEHLTTSLSGQETPQRFILGCTTDPLFPVKGKFDNALKLSEWLVKQSPAQLCVQTRSPLVLLLLPLFRQLRDRFTLTVALETLDDAEALRHSPTLPRPSERLGVAKTFHELGLRVHVQFAPMLGKSVARRKLRECALRIAEVSTFISVLPYSSLETRQGASIAQSKNTGLENAFSKSAQLLRDDVQEIAPQKLVFSRELGVESEMERAAA